MIAPGVDGDVEQLGGRHCDVVALAVDLVRPVAEHRVELLHRGGDQSGWATQVPSKPSPASRSCPRASFAIAARFASASVRLGMNAAMPPIACAPRRWQVLTSSSV